MAIYYGYKYLVLNKTTGEIMKDLKEIQLQYDGETVDPTPPPPPPPPPEAGDPPPGNSTGG